MNLAQVIFKVYYRIRGTHRAYYKAPDTFSLDELSSLLLDTPTSDAMLPYIEPFYEVWCAAAKADKEYSLLVGIRFVLFEAWLCKEC